MQKKSPERVSLYSFIAKNMEMIRLFFDISFFKFLIVGGINYILASIIMLSLYDLGNFSYWFSSTVAFALCSIISYILNKKFSFKSNVNIRSSVAKFLIVVLISYITAFSISKYVIWTLNKKFAFGFEYKAVEKIALVFAQFLYTFINFSGQRFWVFKKQSI